MRTPTNTINTGSGCPSPWAPKSILNASQPRGIPAHALWCSHLFPCKIPNLVVNASDGVGGPIPISVDVNRYGRFALDDLGQRLNDAGPSAAQGRTDERAPVCMALPPPPLPPHGSGASKTRLIHTGPTDIWTLLTVWTLPASRCSTLSHVCAVEYAGSCGYAAMQRVIIGPLGFPITLTDLPAPGRLRWCARRKAEVVAAVEGGLLSKGIGDYQCASILNSCLTTKRSLILRGSSLPTG
jgi:hypothetical protein